MRCPDALSWCLAALILVCGGCGNREEGPFPSSETTGEAPPARQEPGPPPAEERPPRTPDAPPASDPTPAARESPAAQPRVPSPTPLRRRNGERWYSELEPERVDYARALGLHDEALSLLRQGDTDAAVPPLVDASLLGFPPAQEVLALLLEERAPDAAYFWARIAHKLSKTRYWEWKGLRVGQWGAEEERRVRALNDRVAPRIGDERMRRIVELEADIWVKKHAGIILTEHIRQQNRRSQVLAQDSVGQRALEAIDAFGARGLGIICSPTGEMEGCRGTSEWSPEVSRERCLAWLRELGFSDPCPAIVRAR